MTGSTDAATFARSSPAGVVVSGPRSRWLSSPCRLGGTASVRAGVKLDGTPRRRWKAGKCRRLLREEPRDRVEVEGRVALRQVVDPFRRDAGVVDRESRALPGRFESEAHSGVDARLPG